MTSLSEFQWRFAVDSPGGREWLSNPRSAAVIEYASRSTRGQWKRILVATRASLWSELSSEAAAIALPATLILPKDAADGLERSIEVALESGMCDALAAAVGAA
jgi:hypothetical protein